MSISDVAKRAGVSVTTASRVINNSDYPVREATRQRVLQAIAELNYSPSLLARALVTRQSKIVGIIVHDILDPYFAEIVRGVQDAAREYGYLAMVCNSDRQIATEASYLHALDDYRVDGVVLAGGGLTGEGADELEQTIRHIQARGAFVVAIAPQHFEALQVTVDNAGACREMTEYLIGLGHRRIALVAGPRHVLTAEVRREAILDTLRRAGIPIEPALLVDGNFDIESGHRAAEYFLGLPSLPTAIFAANDDMAIGCLVALRRHGVRIPGDVTVVGYGDLNLFQSIDPLLTTIQVPLHDLGAMAMHQLVRAFRGEAHEPVCVLPHQLIVRESSGPPRAAS